jgi:hypothetical protein
LETQLAGFPRSKFWDVMDAAAYITKIMEMEHHYFDPEDDYKDDPEKEFEELEDEQKLEWDTVI